ncbi:hypothetical protein [Deinococcus cellulosilyticus]|uniref:Uncharacterized protein n=1 Tax=Deinococcus cellulosilyticus (strain DSM 18568 / NBRC 106333 / KACC 11606 / 5516J-15) TaxID=1223518 RepID=A0A511N839_DEIC1|nr:hypothetical protein [Deinococcus cellulosilyticus]GEM48646.1 hypothetical protein DC3_42810 [Deinococcus cellulosilyticus NBRC 106333 = KACC 11606]
MSHNDRDKTHFEETITLGNGRTARRCQAFKKGTDQQCSQPCVEGYNVCRVHGAGTKKRLAPETSKPVDSTPVELRGAAAAGLVPEPSKPAQPEGQKRPPGRPPTHGLYSKQGRTNIQQLMQQIMEMDADLDNTDRELATLKATLWHLLEQQDQQSEYADQLSDAMGVLRDAIGEQEDPGQVKAIMRAIQDALKLQALLSSWLDNVTSTAALIIKASKERAETRAKMAEAKALEHFGKLVLLVRHIVWEILPEEDIDAFEDRLRREVLGPNRLDVPAGPRGKA